MRIKFKRLKPEATLPTYGTEFSAAFDLYSPVSGHVMPNSQVLIPIGWAWECPVEYFGLIKERSGLAFNAGLMVKAGVIDPDYRKEIGVILFNPTTKKFNFDVGDRIAQMIMLQRHQFHLLEVEELSVSNRTGGFGSTGLGRQVA